jgi:hypothetical protein
MIEPANADFMLSQLLMLACPDMLFGKMLIQQSWFSRMSTVVLKEACQSCNASLHSPLNLFCCSILSPIDSLLVWKVYSNAGDRWLLPMHRALSKVPVSFIGAYVPCCNIGLNFATLISHMENDGALTLIDVAMDVFDGCNPTTYLYIDMGIIYFAEVWAIGYNPAVINDLGLSSLSRVRYGHRGTNSGSPAVYRIAIMSQEHLLTEGLGETLATLLISWRTPCHAGTFRVFLTTWPVNHSATNNVIQLELLIFVWKFS